MAATLELFNFVLHGEQRDGIFGHGPYDLGGGSLLLAKEFNDLRNDYMPWASTATRVPVANVAVIQVARDVEVNCDMFGSMTVHPHEIDDRLERIVVLTNEDGALREVDIDEVVAIQEAAADAQEELFLKAVEWDARYKIEYGAPMFANHLKPFLDAAGPGRGCGAAADGRLPGHRRPDGGRDARGRAAADLGPHGEPAGRLLLADVGLKQQRVDRRGPLPARMHEQRVDLDGLEPLARGHGRGGHALDRRHGGVEVRLGSAAVAV